jgi:antitoxin component YwqK of YwqJK toxin-antitoxin module
MGSCNNKEITEYYEGTKIPKRKYHLDEFGHVNPRYQMKIYHKNGKINEIFFVDKEERAHGLSLLYNEDGYLLWKKLYKDGLQHGHFLKFYQGGEIKAKGTYENNELEGSYTEYYVYGGKSLECTYKNGKREGLCTEYYCSEKENVTGNKSCVCTYKNDNKEGDYVTYHENDNNKIHEIATWKHDKLHGLLTSWNIKGDKVDEINFRNNEQEGELKVWDDGFHQWLFMKQGYIYIDISLHLAGWKIFNKLIINKKRKMLIKKMLRIKDKIYNLQGDNTIYQIIITYLNNKEITKILYDK